MLRYLLLCLLTTIFVTELIAQNQHKIDFALYQAMQRDQDSEFKVGISFHNNVDFDSLSHFFDANDIPVKQRPVYVIKSLQKVAKESQEET